MGIGMEEIAFNKRELADSLHNLQSSLDQVSASITKNEDPMTTDFTPPRETTLQQLKRRIAILCNKPPINFSELDEMFLSPDEREKLKELNMSEMEQSVSNSLMDKAVDSVTQKKEMDLPQLPQVPEPARPEVLPTQNPAPQVPPSGHGAAPAPAFEHPSEHAPKASMPEIVDAIDQPVPEPQHGHYDDLLHEIKSKLQQ